MTDHEEAPATETPRYLVVPRLRAAVGRQMTLSKTTIPHFYVSADIVVDGLLASIRQQVTSPHFQRISLTTCVAHATARTLVEHPTLNAAWSPDGFVQSDNVNLGVAIALPDGVIAPAIVDCDRLDLQETAMALEALVEGARSGRLRAASLASATFTVSNLGMFDIASFAAVIVPHQVGILALGRAGPRPVVESGTVVVRSMLTATLSADHRIVDGAEAAAFLSSFKRRLEHWVPEGDVDMSEEEAGESIAITGKG